MTWKSLAIAIYVTLTAISSTDPAIGQEVGQPYSHKELHRLVASARDPDDYRKLSEYFHQQKQVYRAKADAEMHEYAKWFSFYHPKVPTSAENASRLYIYYSAKAEHAATLATHYDDLLVRNGLNPVSEALTVSVVNMGTVGAISQPPKQASYSAFPQRLDRTSKTVCQREKP